MKYCSHCGAELNDEAVVCIHCGCSVSNNNVNGAPSRINVLSIIGFVFAFIIPIVGLVCSIIGLNQIKTDPKLSGKGLATAGLVLSIVFLSLSALSVILRVFFNIYI